jgi:multiple antibiotic resistance protein
MSQMELTHHFDFIIGLFAMMDPLAAIPVMLGITAGFTAAQRRRTVLAAFIGMTSILLLSQYSGVWLLETLGTSLASLQIAGGLVIAWSGFTMLTQAGGEDVPVGSGTGQASPFQLGIVPLAVPLLAGPGAITKVLLEAQDSIGVDDPVHITINVLIVCVACGLVLLLADTIGRIIGQAGIIIFNRVFGLLVIAIGVEIVVSGIAAHVGTITG